MANYSLLSYFEQEMRFLREESLAFAKAHPNAAAALGMKADGVDDPELQRLLESIALLNGRLQQELDQTYPDLVHDLLDLLYPHFNRPLPSFSLLHLSPTADAKARHHIPKGTRFSLFSNDVNAYQYETHEGIDVYPIKIASASVHFAPFNLMKPLGAESAEVVLALTLETCQAGGEFSSWQLPHLDFHLTGDAMPVMQLCDFFLQGCLQVCVETEKQTHILGKHAIQPLNFSETELSLPRHTRSFSAFCLLQEFIAYPEKFSGFRVDLSSIAELYQGERLRFLFFAKSIDTVLANQLQAEYFALFVCPIFNLYRQPLEPVNVTFLQHEYPLTLDASSRQKSIFQIEKVTDISEGEPRDIPQLYQETYQKTDQGYRWQVVQRIKEAEQVTYALRVADVNQTNPSSEDRLWQLDALLVDHVKATTFGHPCQVECVDTVTAPIDMKVLKRPTATLHHGDQDKSQWVLLSHLHLNYQAIFDSEQPVKTLQTLLSYYTPPQNKRFYVFIDALHQLESHEVVAPIRVNNQTCFVHGNQINLVILKSKIHAGLSVFCYFLDAFFSCFAGVCSFTQLNVYVDSVDELYLSFPRREGCKSLN